MNSKDHPNHKDLLIIIEDAKKKVKESNTYKDLLKEYGIEDENYIDLVPVAFDEISVSAATTSGCIYLNYSLLDRLDDICHYLIHEFQHNLDQTKNDGPTHGSADSEDYLSNPYELDGFRTQTEYISETEGDEKAQEYIDKVLRHHNISEEEKPEKRKELLGSIVSEIKKEASFEIFDIFKPYLNKIHDLFDQLSEEDREKFNKEMRESFDRIFGTEYKDLSEKKFFGGYAFGFEPDRASDVKNETWHALFHEILEKEVHLKFRPPSNWDDENYDFNKYQIKLFDHLNEDIVSILQFGRFIEGRDSYFVNEIKNQIETDLVWSKEGEIVVNSKNHEDAFNFVLSKLNKIKEDIQNYKSNLQDIAYKCISSAIKYVLYSKTETKTREPEEFENFVYSPRDNRSLVYSLAANIKYLITKQLQKLLLNNLSKTEVIPQENIQKFRFWILHLYKYIQNFKNQKISSLNIQKNASFEIFDIFKPYIEKINNKFNNLPNEEQKEFNQFMRNSFDRIFGTEYANLADSIFFAGFAFTKHRTLLELNKELWHALFHELFEKAIHEKFIKINKNEELPSFQDFLNEDIVTIMQNLPTNYSDFVTKFLNEVFEAADFITKKVRNNIFQNAKKDKYGNFGKLPDIITNDPTYPDKIWLKFIIRKSLPAGVTTVLPTINESHQWLVKEVFNYINKLFKFYLKEIEIDQYHIKRNVIEKATKFLYSFLRDKNFKKEVIPNDIIHKFRLWILTLNKEINKNNKIEKGARRIELSLLSKQAGLFKPPPDLFETLKRQMFQLYTSEVWYRINNILKQNQGRVSLIDHLNFKPQFITSAGEQFEIENKFIEFKQKINKSKEEWESLLDNLTPENKISFALVPNIQELPINFHYLSIIIKKLEEDKYRILIEFYDKEMAEDVITENIHAKLVGKNRVEIIANKEYTIYKLEDLEFLVEPYFNKLSDFVYDMQVLDNHTIVEFIRIIKECQKYTDQPQFFTKEPKSLFLDLMQIVDAAKKWEYINPNDKELLPKLKNFGWFETLPIDIYINTIAENHVGLWEPTDNHKRLSIIFSLPTNEIRDGISLKDFKVSLNDANNTLFHELQHLGQTLLKDVKRIKNPERKHEEGGLPSKKVHELKSNIITLTQKFMKDNLLGFNYLGPIDGKMNEELFNLLKLFQEIGLDKLKIIFPNVDKKYNIPDFNIMSGNFINYNKLIKVIRFVDKIHKIRLEKQKNKKTKDQKNISSAPEQVKEREEHALRDIEFYTNLSSAVQAFKTISYNLPDDLKKEYAKMYVGLPNNLVNLIINKKFKNQEDPSLISHEANYLSKEYYPINMFITLRDEAPNKWKKAVKEFFKSINI